MSNMGLDFSDSFILRLFKCFNKLLLILDCGFKLKNLFSMRLALLIKISLPIIFELDNQWFELLCNLLKKLILVLLSFSKLDNSIVYIFNLFSSLEYFDEVLICRLFNIFFELLHVFLGHICNFFSEFGHSPVHQMLSVES